MNCVGSHEPKDVAKEPLDSKEKLRSQESFRIQSPRGLEGDAT